MASAKKFFKRLGRKTAKIHVKVNRVFTPVVAAGAGFFFGAPGAAAVTAAGAEASRYFRATQARNEGQHSRARALGRGERKRVAIYGAAAGGAGMVGAGLTTAFGGGTLGQSVSSGLFGQYGSHILGNTGTIFATGGVDGVSTFVTAGNLAAQKASPVPGLVTQSQLSPALAGGSTPAELAAAAAGGASTTDKLITTGMGLLQAYGQAKPVPYGTPGINPNAYGPQLSDLFPAGGGGGGSAGGEAGGGGFMNAPMGNGESGMSNGAIAALAVGALLLLA